MCGEFSLDLGVRRHAKTGTLKYPFKLYIIHLQCWAPQPCISRNHTMKIEKNSAVTMQFKLTEASGKVIENSGKPAVYLHGGYGNTLPKIEEALEGKETGYAVTLNLAAADAFGVYDEALLRTLPKKQFPPGVKLGGQLEGRGDDGSVQVFTVMKIKGDTVYMDANHALAGKDIRFDLKVISVRPATEEEITHQHVHGEHGHQH
jgi:FKBP-type peptidyl-prolyl cis-trans isomerase SlyD